MKKLILALAVAGSFTTTIAQAEFTADEHETCTFFEDLAAKIMDARQTGTAMKDAMQLAIDAKSDIAMDMVEQAYSEAAYSTEKYQQEAVNEFADKWYGDCYQIMNKAD